MYPISIDLRARFERGERKRARIMLSNANGTQIITEEDIKADSFSVDRYCATGNKIEIGSAVSSEFSVVLNNHDGRFDDIVFEGSDLCVDVGFDWSDGNYVRCGFFTVDEPPRTFSTISIKALDYMMRYDKEIDHTKLSDAYYTPETLVRKISELCGVEVSSEINFDALPNSAESLSIPTTATTYRQLLQWVAEITATCAYIGWDGNLRMSWFVDTPVNITPSLRYTGDVHENDIEITGVTVKTQDATATSGGDKYPLLIEGNGFVYSQTEQDRANNVGAVVNGFTYRPYECTCLPMPYLFPLDRITYTDKSGKEISTVVTNHRFGLNSTSILAAQGETQQKKNYASQRGLTKAEVDSAIAEAMKNFDSSTEHFYVKYSAYEKGRDTDGKVSMFDKVQADTAYLGTCATDSKTPPESPEDYNWVKIRPEDGEPGRGVVSVKTQYYRSTSSTTQTGGSWTDTMPAWVEDTYLWKREIVTYENPSGTKTGTPILDTSWDALGDIKEDASDAKEKASAVEVASKELNKTLAGALGLHLTEQTIAGSVVRYYHTNPTLSASKSGDTILVLNANGFGVCKSGWNNGNPQFSYGTTFDGKAVWDILTANKINADLIEAGKIKSVDGAAVNTELDLDTGNFILETADTVVTIKGAETDSNGIEHSAGIEVASKAKGDNFSLSLSGLFYTTFEYALELLKYFLSNGKLDKPEDPYYSAIMPQDIKTADLHCKNIFISDGNGGEESLIDELRTFVADTGREVSELRTAVQNLEAVLNTHSHSYASIVTKSATCTEEGTRKFTCSCGDSYTESIPALGHIDSNGDAYCDRCGELVGKLKLTATYGASGKTSQDVYHMASGVDGTGTYYGTSSSIEVPDTLFKPLYFYANAGAGRVITQITFSGMQSETKTAAQLVSDGYLSTDHRTLNYPFPIINSHGGKSISATVYFDNASSGGGTGSGETKEIVIGTFIGTVSVNGATAVKSKSYTLNVGESVTLRFYPDDGYGFGYWQDAAGNVLSYSNPYTFTVDSTAPEVIYAS